MKHDLIARQGPNGPYYLCIVCGKTFEASDELRMVNADVCYAARSVVADEDRWVRMGNALLDDFFGRGAR